MRSEKLKEAYNAYWQTTLNVNDDLFSKMSLGGFVNLKKAVSNINNIITLETTKQFVEHLVDKSIVTITQADKMKQLVEATNANTNGFDIEYPLKRDDDSLNGFQEGELKIIAEVKCCIPADKSSYGAAQEDSIIADVKYLAEGKTKSLLTKEDISQYYKFLVLLGSDNEKEQDKVLISADKIVKKTSGKFNDCKVELYKDRMILDTSTIYVFIINY